ncbi:unnamed protein product [Urochloa humidicola]
MLLQKSWTILLMMMSCPHLALVAADKYELPRLRLLCESYLCKHVSVNSAAATLALAERHHAMELESVCLKFAAKNLSAVIWTEGFHYVKDLSDSGDTSGQTTKGEAEGLRCHRLTCRDREH